VAPGVTKPGSVVKEPVSQVDLYPTLTELAGVKVPDNLQGQSLVPMLKDPAAKGRGWALTQVNRGGGGKQKGSAPKGAGAKKFFGYSLRTERWRYTEWDEGKEGRELYDHESDAGELVNLAGKPEHAATVEELGKILREAVKGTFPKNGQTPEVGEVPWSPMLVP
jgi:arylsulfatase A-like enzyme